MSSADSVSNGAFIQATPSFDLRFRRTAQELRETNELLRLKITKLEQLLRLKDAKIERLTQTAELGTEIGSMLP